MWLEILKITLPFFSGGAGLATPIVWCICRNLSLKRKKRESARYHIICFIEAGFIDQGSSLWLNMINATTLYNPNIDLMPLEEAYSKGDIGVAIDEAYRLMKLV